MYRSKKSSAFLTSGVLMALFLHSNTAASRTARDSKTVLTRSSITFRRVETTLPSRPHYVPRVSEESHHFPRNMVIRNAGCKYSAIVRRRRHVIIQKLCGCIFKNWVAIAAISHKNIVYPSDYGMTK